MSFQTVSDEHYIFFRHSKKLHPLSITSEHQSNGRSAQYPFPTPIVHQVCRQHIFVAGFGEDRMEVLEEQLKDFFFLLQKEAKIVSWGVL